MNKKQKRAVEDIKAAAACINPTDDKVFYPKYKGVEYELFQRMGKPIECDGGCMNKIKKGDFYTESDAGEKYCEACSTE